MSEPRLTLGPCPQHRGLMMLFPPSENYLVLNGKLVDWNEEALGPMPLLADLEVANAFMLRVDTLRGTLNQIFSGLGIGAKVALRPTWEATQKCYLAGDVVSAREIIETTPVNETLEPVKTAILAAHDAAFLGAN